MKQKLNIFRVGSKTYFHHQNGTLVQKSRLQLTALRTLSMMIAASGLFVCSQYLLPALQSVSYFQTKNVTTQNIVAVQPEPQDPIQAPIVKEDELLKMALNQKIKSFPNAQNWAVYAYELGTDRTVSINHNQDFDAGSLYKMFLLEALENKLAYSEWANTYVKGKSISSCVETMLQVADDPCSEALAEYIGWEFIDEFNFKNGFEKTSLAGLEGRKTTAAEIGDLFIRLKKGHTLSDNARRFVFDALYQQAYSKGIAKGCVQDCRAATKAGELSNVSHDAGVVTHGGKSYVLIIMSHGGSFSQVSELTKLVDERYGLKAD